MSAQSQEWAIFMAMDGESAEFEVERETIQYGRSVSAAAMNTLLDSVGLFIGTRIMRRWEATNEPPTVVRVIITVEAQ